MKRINKSQLKLPIVAVVIGVTLAGLAAGAWFLRPQEIMEEARVALEGNENVKVEEREINGVGGFLFSPKNESPETGLIFYPGARVPVRAYAPNALVIAEEGYEVFLVKMPLNLAVLGSGKAGEVISGKRDVEDWVVAGHSMGGAMAARFVANAEPSPAGLVLWASYPPEGAEFDPGLSALSITASRDGVISSEKLDRAEVQLPPDTEFVEIEGGNHSQFGWYGFQSGDDQATIGREEQMMMVTEETADFLSSTAAGSRS
ncbi:MAG: alpha/beta hydrolase [Candidatus Acetothermia bacterium]